MFFWYVRICIFWKLIQYTIHWDKIQILKKFPSDKISVTKNTLSFLWTSTHHKFTLIHDSYMSWSTRFASLKMSVGFSIFDSVLFLLKHGDIVLNMRNNSVFWLQKSIEIGKPLISSAPRESEWSPKRLVTRLLPQNVRCNIYKIY